MDSRPLTPTASTYTRPHNPKNSQAYLSPTIPTERKASWPHTQQSIPYTSYQFPFSNFHFPHHRVTANSATILASTSIPFANDASGIRSSFPCIRCKSSLVSGNGHSPYDCTLCNRNCAESVAHGD